MQGQNSFSPMAASGVGDETHGLWPGILACLKKIYVPIVKSPSESGQNNWDSLPASAQRRMRIAGST